ncbi:hypothetical protein BDN67DRAFT_982216 [Paxillus ammoniavirescens]|nr:hypothetical protein BDN67DRAFT_982216 [Paxillus ammoniavirescens]
MLINADYGECSAFEAPTAQKQASSSALQLGPRKKPTTQDPIVHHSRHFGRAVHAFCNVQTLVTNGLILMAADGDEETLTAVLEHQLMDSSEEEVMTFADLVQKGANGARADDTKGMKAAIIDWITPKGQSLNPHIPCNIKSGRGFNHDHTRALLCPAGLDWANTKTRAKLINGQIQVAGDQWPVMLYTNYMYDPKDTWNNLLRSGLLVSAFKHIFMSPSSVDQEPKATRSGNARIYGMHCITKASVAYISTQASRSLQYLITDSEHFYNSILALLEDPDEKEEVDQLMTWWNHQVFPLYAEVERIPSKNSTLVRIHQKHAEVNERNATIGN